MTISNIIRKTSRTFKFVFTNKDTGAVVDIATWKIHFTAKVKIIDADVDAIITKTTTAGAVIGDDPVNGLMFLKLDPADTDVTEQTLSYNFVREIPGSPADIEVLEQSTFKIEKNNLVLVP